MCVGAMGLVKTLKLGVSEFSSGEHPPGIVVCFKNYAWMTRCGTENTGCQSLVRGSTPRVLLCV